MMSWVAQATCMGTQKKYSGYLDKKCEGKTMVRKNILICKKQCKCVVCIHLVQCRASAGLCEYKHKNLGFIQDREFLNQLSDWALLKTNCLMELVKCTGMPVFQSQSVHNQY
jgi:hypothetical protein